MQLFTQEAKIKVMFCIYIHNLYLVALNGGLEDQRKHLFANVFPPNNDITPFQPVVIVVDGLDNCGGDRASQAALAGHLVKLAASLPWIKLVVTSRDRPDLRRVLEQAAYSMDIKTARDTDRDISLYIQAGLTKLEVQLEQSDRDHLVAERVDVRNVRVGDLGAHGDLGGGLHGCLEVLGENGGEVGGGSVCPEA